MKWENSRALTPLKRDFLKAFFTQGREFFLTGGSALGIFYLGHRVSYDLDLFSTAAFIDWHVLDNDVRSIAQTLGAETRSVTVSPTFRRYELNRGAEREILDFVLERVPQIDPEKTLFGNVQVDTLREITANKICTLISRCETKDLIDLYFLAKRGVTLRDHLADARRKEAGLDPAMMAFLLSRTTLDEPPDYLLEPLDMVDFAAFVRGLQRELADLSHPSNGEPQP